MNENTVRKEPQSANCGSFLIKLFAPAMRGSQVALTATDVGEWVDKYLQYILLRCSFQGNLIPHKSFLHIIVFCIDCKYTVIENVNERHRQCL